MLYVILTSDVRTQLLSFTLCCDVGTPNAASTLPNKVGTPNVSLLYMVTCRMKT